MDVLAVFNALPGNHLVLLPDAPRFTIMAATDAYLGVTYTERAAIVGKGIFEVFTDDATNLQATGVVDLSASLHHVICHKQTHYLTDLRYDIVLPSTGRFQHKVWKTSNQPVLNEASEIQYIINTVEDITQAAQLVKVTEANQYLQALINEFREPLQVLQPLFEDGELIDFRFKLVNQAYAAYANATPEQLQGKRVGDVFPGYVETVSFKNPVETYKTGQPLSFEIHYDKDGLDLYNRMSTCKMDEEIIIHFTDFTQERHLQYQLESKLAELERSNDNLQQFAYIASHDLQEPLRKIQSFGALLEEQYGPNLGEGIDYLQRMQASAGRMSTLIQDLLTYSRIATQRDLNKSIFLADVISSVLTDLDMLISDARATIHVGSLPTVSGDAQQLGQLFQNLLSNAIKFRQPNTQPKIRVEASLVMSIDLPQDTKPTHSATTYHRINVIDNGIGFDQKYAHRIFQVFQRLHGKQHYTGTGIGLAICEKVVINHGGAITVSSQPGQGATFSVYLPADH